MNKFISISLVFLISCSSAQTEADKRINQAIEEITTTTTTTTSTTTTTTLPPRYGNWTVEISDSPLDNSVSYFGYIDSIKTLKSKDGETLPRLVIKCNSTNYEMYINTGQKLTPFYDGEAGQVLGRIRLGQNEPKDVILKEDSESKLVFFSSPELLIGYLTTVDKILFEVTPNESNTDYADFEIDGIYNFVSDMQKDCTSKKVNIGLYAADEKINIDKLIKAGGDFFWHKNFGEEFVGGFISEAGNFEFSPVRVRFQGNWDEDKKINFQNKILTIFSKVVFIEFVEGDADIVIHPTKTSAEKNWGKNIDREYGFGFYWESFDYCEFWIDDVSYIPIYIFGCLGNNSFWGETSSSISFSKDTFVENELYVDSPISKIDLAILGLVYQIPPTSTIYTKDSFLQELGKYLP